jgi:NADH:ubiquinone oxidoreductase subunit C
MITGIHWPEKENHWQVVVHLMRMGVKNPKGEPIIVDTSNLVTSQVPVEIEVNMSLPAGREPSVPSVADVWVGADWNEKETWDLLGIDFEGHEGMRRVLLPHDTPTGYHPLQKQHKLRYHDFNEMYDDPQGFGRKPADIGRQK